MYSPLSNHRSGNLCRHYLLTLFLVLSEASTYDIKILTRSAKSADAVKLGALPNVTIVEGDAHDEATLLRAFKGIELAWVNTNGFAIGEKNEIFWGMRTFELARFSGVQHFQYASIPYVSKLSGFDPRFRTGHMDGKGRVADFITAQPSGGGAMAWTVLSSCMYIEMLSELFAPRPHPTEPDVMVFATPFGDGQPPLIHLDDIGRYAKWVFEHPERSSGMYLQVATENIGWEYLAKTFTEVTGKKAVSVQISPDVVMASGYFPEPDATVGRDLGHPDPTGQTWRQNFEGFWNVWRAGIVKVDYALLDEILPTRVKSLGEWMKVVGYTGEPKSVLGDYKPKSG